MNLDLSAYDLNDLTPDQIAAFWRLDLLTSQDIPLLAMRWLEGGAESDAVAVLAGEDKPTLHEHGKLFEKAIVDLGGRPPSSTEEAYWTLVRFLLGHIATDDKDPFPAASQLIMLAHWRAPDLTLFTRPDLPPIAERIDKYAGEGMGIENLIGAIFALDDFDNEQHPDRVASIKHTIKAEAATALAKFYTLKPMQFPAVPPGPVDNS